MPPTLRSSWTLGDGRVKITRGSSATSGSHVICSGPDRTLWSAGWFHALTHDRLGFKLQDWRLLQLCYKLSLDDLTLTSPAARIRGIPARTIVLGLLRERAQDPAPVRALGILKRDRRIIRRHAVLDPRAQLLEQAGRLPARAAPAVREAGDLEEAVEVVGVAEEGLDRAVVVAGVAVGDEVVVL
jgi:hypothetical protein